MLFGHIVSGVLARRLACPRQRWVSYVAFKPKLVAKVVVFSGSLMLLHFVVMFVITLIGDGSVVMDHFGSTRVRVRVSSPEASL